MITRYDYVYVPTSKTTPHITTPVPYISSTKAISALPAYPRLILIPLPIHTH